MQKELEQVKKLVSESNTKGAIVATGSTPENQPMIMIRLDKDDRVIKVVDIGECVYFEGTLTAGDRVCLKQHKSDSFEWMSEVSL